MQRKMGQIGLVAAGFVLCWGVAQPTLMLGQETQKSDALTLEQAVRMALDQNPAFRESSDEAEVARARLKQVQAGWLPKIDFHQDFTRGNNPVCVFGTKLAQRQFSSGDLIRFSRGWRFP